jgi:uncharacterized protein YcbK (DUF882 family)
MTQNFSKSEFDSKDGAKMPPEVLANIVKLAGNLEALRALLNAPIKINSGYRSIDHNKSIKGVKGSRHTKGLAADIVVEGYDTEQVFEAIEYLIKQGEMQEGGLGMYDTFVHYDIRGTKARWNG